MAERARRIGTSDVRDGSRCGGPRRGRTWARCLLLAAVLLVPSRIVAQPAGAMPSAPAGGHLVLRGTDGSERLAPVLEVDAAVRVSGMIARGTLVQRFINDGDGWVEAVYVFPLAADAAVDGLRMRIGERVIEGEIREREEARRVYERARAEGRRASLLEQNRPNAFTSRVANVAPRAEIAVEIDFLQSVDFADGEFALRLPWIVAPRFFPAGAGGDDAEATTLLSAGADEAIRASDDPFATTPDVALGIDLDVGYPLDEIASPTHAVELEQTDVHRFLVTLRDGIVPADRDFVLRWRPVAGARPAAALFSQRREGEDHVLLMLLPPDGERPLAHGQHEPREIVFVIDTSGSMGGPSIEQARAALRLAVERLDVRDRFNLIAFDSDARALFPGAMHADSATREKALSFIDDLRAGGGTNMLPALRLALQDDDATSTGLRQIVFVTDGCVGNERELFATVRQRLGRSRLFTVGIGSAPNGHFMDGAARFGRGARVSIAAPEEVGEKMAALFGKLERPAVTDLEILWPDRTEAWPARLPDLYTGEPLVVAARVSRYVGDVVVRGRFDGAPWEATLPLTPGRPELGIDKLFARRKIAARMDGLVLGDDADAVRKDVTRVALEYGLVSRYTSLVAVERTPARARSDALHAARVNPGMPAGFMLPQGDTPATLLRTAALLLASLAGSLGAWARRRVAS